MERVYVFASMLAIVVLMACTPVLQQPASNSTTQSSVQPVKEPQASAEFEVTDLKASTDSAIEGDNVSVTATISNKGKASGSYKVVFKIDTKPSLEEEISILQGETTTSIFYLKERAACIRTVEVGSRSLPIIFHPVGDINNIDQTGFMVHNSHSGFNYVFSMNRYINLNENYQAKNPSFEQLISYLKTKDYSKDPYAVETLHNEAEISGIKCAFVWMETENNERETQGSVSQFLTINKGADYMNAFQTTDKGMVIVHPRVPGFIVYLEKGKPMALIGYAHALFTDYRYFEKYSSMVTAEIERYKQLGIEDPTKKQQVVAPKLIFAKADCYW
jgi:hypothetical protein